MPSAAADPTDKPEHTAWSAHPFATDAARASVEALEADGALGDDALRLRLTGSNVEMTQCGISAARVYWAYYFEDRNHDSGSPLMNFIRTE